MVGPLEDVEGKCDMVSGAFSSMHGGAMDDEIDDEIDGAELFVKFDDKFACKFDCMFDNAFCRKFALLLDFGE
jgi:hypothetical protein